MADDTYTKLLLHADQIIPYDECRNIIVSHGNAGTSDEQKKFGDRAFKLVNTTNTDWFSTAGIADFQFGAGDFTIDGWYYPTALPATISGYVYKILFSMRSGSQSNEQISMAILKSATGYKVRLWFTYNGSAQYFFDVDGIQLSINNWYHFAIVRNGTELYMFIDGIKIGTYAIGANSLYPSTADFMIGGGNAMDSASFWDGYIDEFRISKGIARWITDFTPPTVQYGEGTNYLDIIPDEIATKLLLHFDQVFTPYDECGNVVSAYGNTIGSTEQKKFGNRSFKFINTSNTDYLVVPNSVDLQLVSVDFTIESWIYPTALPETISGGAYKIIFSMRTGNSNNEQMDLLLYKTATGYKLVFIFTYNGAGQLTMNADGLQLAINNWYHFAIVRRLSEMYIFLDGAKVATYTISGNSLYPSTASLIIGGGNAMDVSTFWRGYMDEFRISKGIARWTADFTPPAVQYGNGTSYELTADDDYTSLLMHMNDTDLKDDYLGAIPTKSGNVAYSETNKKFGTGSCLFDGNSDYLLISANIGRFSFGTFDFTMDCWVYLNAMPTSDAWPGNWSSHMSVMGIGSPSASNGCNLVIGATKLLMNNNDAQLISGLHGMAIHTWYHIAVTRCGSVWRLFVNGNKVAEVTNAVAAGTGNGFYIGCETGEGAWFNGYIDEVRVSTGIARWTENFIPATAAYKAPVSIDPVTGYPIDPDTQEVLYPADEGSIVDNILYGPKAGSLFQIVDGIVYRILN